MCREEEQAVGNEVEKIHAELIPLMTIEGLTAMCILVQCVSSYFTVLRHC